MRITRKQSQLLGSALFGLFIVAVAFFMRNDTGFKSLPADQRADAPSRATHSETVTNPSDAPQQNVAGALPAGANLLVPTIPAGGQFVLDDFHRSEVKDGKKVWEVVAKRGQYYPETNSAKVNQATVTLFREDDPVTIVTNQATLQMEGTALKSATAEDGVSIALKSGGTAKTSNAIFNSSEEVVTSEAPVEVLMERMELRGTGFKVDLKDKSFTLNSEVESVILPKAVLNTDIANERKPE